MSQDLTNKEAQIHNITVLSSNTLLQIYTESNKLQQHMLLLVLMFIICTTYNEVDACPFFEEISQACFLLTKSRNPCQKPP